MKKAISFFLAMVFLFAFVGCKDDAPETEPPIEHPSAKLSSDAWSSIISGASTVDYDPNLPLYSEALNSASLAEDFLKTPIFKIDTKQDLEQFLATHRDHFLVGLSGPPRFDEAVAGYDDAFFQGNTLLIVYAQNGLCQLVPYVTDIYCSNDALCVHLDFPDQEEGCFYFQAGGAWFIVIEIADDLVKDCRSFDVET